MPRRQAENTEKKNQKERRVMSQKERVDLIEVDLLDMCKYILSKWVFILIGMVVFAGAGFGYAKVKSVTEYSSKMQVYVTVPKTSDKVLIRDNAGEVAYDYVRLIKTDLITNEVAKKTKVSKDDVKDVTLEEAEDNYFDFGVDYEIPKKEEKPSVVINAKEVEVNDSDVKIVNHNGTESTAEKIEVKEEPPKRTTRVTVKKELEDTKEFEKVSPEEKTIDEALNGGKDISADEDNDIFNLIDSMYEGDE